MPHSLTTFYSQRTRVSVTIWLENKKWHHSLSQHWLISTLFRQSSTLIHIKYMICMQYQLRLTVLFWRHQYCITVTAHKLKFQICYTGCCIRRRENQWDIRNTFSIGSRQGRSRTEWLMGTKSCLQGLQPGYEVPREGNDQHVEQMSRNHGVDSSLQWDQQET